MLAKDKEIIDRLTAEEVKNEAEYKEKNKKLDKQIVRIWQSTRVSVPFLQHYHETMRMRYKWYYQWHLWPYSRAAHVLILSTYILAMTLFGAHFLSTPKTVMAAGPYGPFTCTFTNANETSDWSFAGNWSGCGGVYYPGQTADLYNVIIPAGKTVWGSAANIDLYGGNVSISGTYSMGMGGIDWC